MNIDNLCMSCMNELYGEKQCPRCGYYVDSPQISPYLPLKTPIGNKYIIGKMLSSNSEGATYMAYDVDRKSPVLIREFLPEKFIDRSFGETELKIKEQWAEFYYKYLNKFLKLWRSLARVRGLSSLVPVIDIVEQNNTAYAVTEYIESISLREFLLKSQTGYLNWEKAKVLFMPVLSTLSALHKMDIVHNGISPDNLMIGRDGKLRLWGFSINEARIEGSELSPELFEGYTPIEQYSYSYENGAWSDVYAFCAVVYRSLVGSVPQDAVTRAMNDQLIIPARYAEIIPVYVINALMNGLQVDPEDRTKDIETLREELSATPSNVVSSYSGASVQKPEKKEVQEVIVEDAGSNSARTVLITFLIILGIGLLVFAGFMAYEHFAGDVNEESSTEASTNAPEMIEVPNFVNSSYDMIAQNPVQNDRFKISSTSEYSTTVEKGYIISQSIAPGTEVEMGTAINFIVSKGPEYVLIPPVEGLNVEFAKASLEEAGFVVNIITKENNGDYEEGVVCEVTPEQGSSKIKGTEVYVQVWGAPPSTEPESEESTTGNNNGGFFGFDFFG